jgi:Bacterial Ig domain
VLSRSTRRRTALVALAAIAAVVAIVMTASADSVHNDLSNSANSANNQATTGVNFPVRFWISATDQDGCNASEDTPAEVSITPAAGDEDKFSFDPEILNITSCGNEQDSPYIMNICPKVAGVYDKDSANPELANNLTINVTDDDGTVYNVLVEAVELTVTDPAEPLAESCDGGGGGGGAGNQAPQLVTPAADVTAPEGTTLTASGEFSDPDGDALTIAATGVPSGSTFTDHGDGTWDWSYPTNDNYGGTINVTATENTVDALTSPTDSFDWSTTNVDPDITGLAVTGGSACTPTVSFGIGDPGTADTWAHAVDFDGGTPTVPTILASPSSYTSALTRTATRSGPYPSTGTKTINVAVMDDDGGSGTESITHEVPNTIGAFQFAPPLLISGNGKGLFNSGATIPVKLRVGACAFESNGAYTPVTGLTLKVLDPVMTAPTAGGILQSTSNVKADIGGWMRSGDGSGQYIYNMGTAKNNPTGTYLLTVQQFTSRTGTPVGSPMTISFALKR